MKKEANKGKRNLGRMAFALVQANVSKVPERFALLGRIFRGDTAIAPDPHGQLLHIKGEPVWLELEREHAADHQIVFDHRPVEIDNFLATLLVDFLALVVHLVPRLARKIPTAILNLQPRRPALILARDKRALLRPEISVGVWPLLVLSLVTPQRRVVPGRFQMNLALPRTFLRVDLVDIQHAHAHE